MTDAPVSHKAATTPDGAGPRPGRSRIDGGATSPAKAPQRSLDAIEADIDATRARLAGRLDELQDYVSPRNIADRQMQKVKGVFVDQYGGIKPDRVLVAVGVVALVIGIGVLRRRRR